MGESNPTVQSVLAGRTPEDVAAALLRGCKLADVAVRKSLVLGGNPAVAASDDPMIRLTRSLDAESRAVRKIEETEIDDVLTAQYALIARALFEDQETSTYPREVERARLRISVRRNQGQFRPSRFVLSQIAIKELTQHSLAWRHS
jgi:Peptidase S46